MLPYKGLLKRHLPCYHDGGKEFKGFLACTSATSLGISGLSGGLDLSISCMLFLFYFLFIYIYILIIFIFMLLYIYFCT